jgi:hypothetical protein
MTQPTGILDPLPVGTTVSDIKRAHPTYFSRENNRFHRTFKVTKKGNLLAVHNATGDGLDETIDYRWIRASDLEMIYVHHPPLVAPYFLDPEERYRIYLVDLDTGRAQAVGPGREPE